MKQILSASNRRQGFLTMVSNYCSPDALLKIIKRLTDIDIALKKTGEKRTLFELEVWEIPEFKQKIKCYRQRSEKSEHLLFMMHIMKLYECWISLKWCKHEAEICKIMDDIERIALQEVILQNVRKTSATKSRKENNSNSNNKLGYYSIQENRHGPYLSLEELKEQLMSRYLCVGKTDRRQSKFDYICEETIRRVPGMADYLSQVRAIKPAKSGELDILIKGVKRDDPEAKARLMELCIRKALVAAWKVSILFDADLEESIGNAFLALSEYFESFKGEKKDLNWLRVYIERKAERMIVPEWQFFSSETFNETRDIIYCHEYSDNHCLSADEFTAFSKEQLEELSEHLIRKNKVKETLHAYYVQNVDSLNNDVSPQELAVFLRVNEYELYKYYDISINTLDCYDADTDEEFSQYDYVPCVETESKLETNYILQQAFSCLSPREQLVISLRSGLYTGVSLSLQDIGTMVGVSRERIRQIETKANNRLKYHIARPAKRPLSKEQLKLEEAAELVAKKFGLSEKKLMKNIAKQERKNDSRAVSLADVKKKKNNVADKEVDIRDLEHRIITWMREQGGVHLPKKIIASVPGLSNVPESMIYSILVDLWRRYLLDRKVVYDFNFRKDVLVYSAHRQ